MIDRLPASIEFVRSGRLRPLAVTSAARGPALPDVPTAAEFIPGSWYGARLPRNTPAEIVDKLNRRSSLADARIAARIVDLGATVQPIHLPILAA
jgi:tripartite-type tricarboxylate transporter receptor subunit TctC